MNLDENLRMIGARRMKNIVSADDRAAMREHYSFLPSESSKKSKKSSDRDTNRNVDRTIPENGSSSGDSSWQERMVTKYHEYLFKEFALADLSVPGRIGLRWRTKEEVLSGRGERTCGNKRCRKSNFVTDGLLTFEVPFSYKEHGEHKKELVKLKLCETCRPLLQQSTKNRTSTMGTNSTNNKLEQNEGLSGKSPDYANTKKHRLNNSHRRYRKEKKRRRKDRT